MTKFLWPIFILIFFFGCGKTVVEEESSNNDQSSEDKAPRSPEFFVGDISAQEGKEISHDGKSFFLEDVQTGYRFALVGAPGFLTIDLNTGLLTGEPEVNGSFEDIRIRATKIADNSTVDSRSFTIAVNGDPLRRFAWHLKNTTQKAFSSLTGTAGFDLNVYDVLKEGVTGQGVKIAVSDSGVEINHDDLYSNQLTGAHRDYSLEAPYTANPTPTNFHGTAVTGIISAVGYNNFGSIGVAPNSKFAGFQFLNSAQSSSIMIHQAGGDFDIFNYSYGDFLTEDTRSDTTYLDHLRYQAITGNKIFVKASGNEFFQSSGNLCAAHNANAPFENESPFIIVVGSIHADGAKSSYSNAGSNLWVSAPGGEDGEGMGPAIITTDLRTCFKGNSIAGTYSSNTFEYNNIFNLQCDYTATMNGTSSATPNVAGVIALMREVNPNLKMRDIKHIFATTSKQVDPTHSSGLNYFGTLHPSAASSSCLTDLTLSGHDYEDGWITNKAGYKFNNFYGFGMVDAKAAVDTARSYVSTIGNQVELNPNFTSSTYRRSETKAIPDGDATGVEDSLVINNAVNLKAETIQVRVQVAHPRSGQVGVELYGPAGSGTPTKSILLNINNTFLFDNDSNLDIVLTTNAFYGESINGTWKIKLIDGRDDDLEGSLVQWEMNILGHE